MQKLRTFFSDRTNILLAAAIAVAVLLVLIIIVLVLLLTSGGGTSKTSTTTPSNDTTKSTKQGNLSSGSVTKFSGSTTSTRNLKGLTLRINQIETCNPKVISAYVAVSADNGVVNTNFSKKDVKVYLDNKEIKDFDFNSVDTTKTPLTSMLVLDHSGSMAGAAMDNAKSAATQYVQKLQPNDQVGVIQFSNTVEILANINTDKSASINAIAGISAKGNTAIYDALNKAVNTVPDCGRKAVIVLSDGDDTSSSSTAESVKSNANKANLPIFSVGIKGEGFNPATIKQISESTGGQYLEANTPTEISGLYGNIDGQLTGQFVANLKLSVPKDGSTHTLKIVSNVEGSPTSSERSFAY
jgi:VWFA-related protein